MKTFATFLLVFMITTLQPLYAVEEPKPAEFEKKYGSSFRISEEAAAKLKNPIEVKLQAIKIPEVEFAQANLADVVYFLNDSATAFDKKKDDLVVVALEKGFMDTKPPLITFASNNVSILEIIKFLTTVTDLKYGVENGVIMLRKSRKPK